MKGEFYVLLLMLIVLPTLILLLALLLLLLTSLTMKLPVVLGSTDSIIPEFKLDVSVW